VEKDSGSQPLLDTRSSRPSCGLRGPSHSFFQFHPKTACNSIDEIKVGNHQGGIKDGPVAPAGLAKKVYVAFPARRRLACEFLGELEQSEFRPGDRCISVLEDDGLDQKRILGFFAEALRMVPDSIVTRVGL
jgi:hypothetical protein